MHFSNYKLAVALILEIGNKKKLNNCCTLPHKLELLLILP